MIALIIIAVFAYLLGSIPFGLLLTRFAGLGDIRNIGSGNIGATNVLRTGNKGLAAATLLLDGAKGAAAVLIVRMFSGHGVFAAGLFALIGHLYPVWLRFKGGKGVATGLGVMLAVSFPVGLLACAAWLGIAFVYQFSSLAALTAFGVMPLLAFLVQGWKAGLLALIIAALVFYKHRANIQRLLAKTEPKIGAK